LGNPSLMPEEATAFESGFKYNKPWLKGHLAYFHRWGSNMIDWIQKPGETIWKAENLTEVNTDGVELSAKIIPEKIWNKRLFIKSFLFSYSWLDQGKESGAFSSKYVLDYLKNKVVFGIAHSVFKKIEANWQIAYEDRNGNYTKWEGTGYGNEVPYNSFWLIDARLYWRHKGTSIYLEASNLLDQRYVDYGNVNQPGRWFKMGIKKQIEL